MSGAPSRLRSSVAALGALTVLSACGGLLGGDSGRVTIGDSRVVLIDETLLEAEATLEAVTSSGPSSLAPDARCYLVFPDGSDEPSGTIRCGPVLFLDSDVASPWLLLSTWQEREAEGSDVLRLRVEQILSFSAPLPATERLWRPDDLEAPASVELALPPAPALPPDFVLPFGAGQREALLGRPQDPEIRSATGTLRVTGVATIDDRVDLPGRGIVRPPDGHVLHLLELDGRDLRGFRELSLSVAGRRVSELQGDGGVAFVAPVGADVQLLLRDGRGIEHLYDVAAGAITRSPALFYRNTSSTVALQRSIPPTISCPDRQFTLNDFPLTMTVSGFDLRYFRLRSDTSPAADSRRLGAALAPLTEEDAAHLDVEESAGLRVVSTIPGSAAALAGLTRDDVVTRIGGTPVLPDTRVIERTLRPLAVGDSLQLEVIRDGERRELTLTLPQWVWLVMDYDVRGGLDWLVPLPAAEWRLLFPGGGSLPALATDVSPLSFEWQAGTFGAEQPAWQVPESFTSATISIAPGSHTRAGCRVDFGDASLGFPVTIPR